jgi:hypothetical protein
MGLTIIDAKDWHLRGSMDDSVFFCVIYKRELRTSKECHVSLHNDGHMYVYQLCSSYGRACLEGF